MFAAHKELVDVLEGLAVRVGLWVGVDDPLKAVREGLLRCNFFCTKGKEDKDRRIVKEELE